MEISDKDIEKWIIKKLVRKRCWGKGHLSADNLVKGQDRLYKSRMLEVADELMRRNILVSFPHGGEKHYYLNSKARKEIYRIVGSL